MVRIIDAKTYCRNYAKKSLMAFLDGGKYAADRKPRTPKWLIGVLLSSGVKGEELVEIFNQLRDYGEKELFERAWEICKVNGLL